MRIPTTEELSALLKTINPRSPFGERDHEMLVLAAHTGLRVSELCGLDVGHVFNHADRSARELLDLPAPLGKGRKSRLVPLNKRARMAVVRLFWFNHKRGFATEAAAPLLVDRRHRRLTPRAVQQVVQDAREAAGLDVRVTPHSLRHYAGTQMARKSGALYPVQEILGHRRLVTTRRYLHSDRADLIRTTDALCEGPELL